MLTLPDEAETFIRSIKFRAETLTSRGFWDIPKIRLDSWSKQFIGLDERFFSACILSNLIFRTKPQFEASLKTLFRGDLNEAFSDFPHDLSLLEHLRGRKDPRLRLVPVIRENDPPTKSGTVVMRRLQRILELNQKWMCWPWQATEALDKNEIDTVLFVDDFLGSGSQFEQFFAQWQFDTNSQPSSFIYAPVVAHQTGVNYLKGKLPLVKIISSEKLVTEHNFFSERNWMRFANGETSSENAKLWHREFCSKMGIGKGSKSVNGFGDLALTFGFSHATPNNTLPILWQKTAKWQPLLER